MIQKLRSLTLVAGAALALSATAASFESSSAPTRWFGEGSGNLAIDNSVSTARFAMDLIVTDTEANSVVTGRIQYGSWVTPISSGQWTAASKRLSLTVPADWIAFDAKIFFTGHIANRLVYNAEAFLLRPAAPETVAADALTQALKLELGLDPSDDSHLIRPAGGATAFAR